ncbi:DUF4342 domain-containing protein [Leptolyngbya cf. ectocarpi LEGE 11479]|uniref:DUF4342 domain-containing protein n=1 Tax=Leptolyngbya cf. ectocarpi LEGE 11479 TaxID=1828722 RepID=A0A929A0B8_LEPEC|nr:DUF4342 domain-containing protein [Leptolyngbya ectocarpi]MBE9070722.1 DUF4342 domain-containing protein [Leptolyngbya cf. ectocarpi LEGE 11479]
MNTDLEEVPQTLDVSVSNVPDSEVVSVTESEKEPAEKVVLEELKISGDALVAEVKELIHQGNIRRIIIKNEEGHTLIEIPMTVGVIGGVISAAFFPVIAAVGIIGAMVAHLTVVIERQETVATDEADQEE